MSLNELINKVNKTINNAKIVYPLHYVGDYKFDELQLIFEGKTKIINSWKFASFSVLNTFKNEIAYLVRANNPELKKLSDFEIINRTKAQVHVYVNNNNGSIYLFDDYFKIK